MALIGWWAILLCIAIYFLIGLCRGILEFIGDIATSIHDKFSNDKKYKAFSNSNDPRREDRQSQNDSSWPSKPVKYGLSGKCEIFGKNFSPTSSATDNYLSDVNFDFYGKERKMKLCNKCCRIMLEDKNCIRIS